MIDVTSNNLGIIERKGKKKENTNPTATIASRVNNLDVRYRGLIYMSHNFLTTWGFQFAGSIA